MTRTFDLSTRAMLVNLNLRNWSGRKFDKAVTDEVDRLHGSHDAGRYTKILIAGPAIAAVKRAASAIRKEHYRLTLPWRDAGERILPAAAFNEYSAKMRKLEAEFAAAADEFCRDYAASLATAAARLNGLYNPADYPAPGAIRGLFGCDVKISPLPSGNDFRVALADEATRAIREAIEADTKASVDAAMREVWNRLYDGVKHMADRLGARPGKKGRRSPIFRDTIVENLRDLVAVLPKLNITGDKELARLRKEVEEKLCGDHPERLRRDAKLRKSKAKEAAAIADKMAGFMGG